MARLLVAANDLTVFVEIFTDVDGEGGNTSACRGSECVWTSESLRPHDPVDEFRAEATIHIDQKH